MTLLVPAGQVAQVEFSNGLAFANGIGIGVSTGATDTDASAPTGNVIANVFYT
jgi:hypothetical protein